MNILKVCLSFFLVFLINQTFAGVAPIKNMPHYNGTYYGSPGTGGNCDSASANCDSTAGRTMFSVLYRDNYNRNSGCAGEGCGKHPGVDITTLSGTPVVASLAGKIVRSECSSSWGGLVIIEADNPYGAGKVYLSYAHLRKRFVSTNTSVVEGGVIGESGGEDGLDSQGKPNGRPKDDCPGFSTGPHLHFQVDKPHGGSYPWYPTNRVESKDSNFEVTTKTHNPLPFVTGYGYVFTFSENKNKEMWGASGVNGYDTASGSLWVDSESNYSYVGRSDLLPATIVCYDSRGKTCSRSISLDTAIFKRMYLDINFACSNIPVIIWFKNSIDKDWNRGIFTYTGPRAYALGMSSLASWKGMITDFIIQPFANCDNGGKEYFYKMVLFY